MYRSLIAATLLFIPIAVQATTFDDPIAAAQRNYEPPPPRVPAPPPAYYPPYVPPGVMIIPWEGRTVPCLPTLISFGWVRFCI
jgi:hypothetical protein